ncbi:MAG TPA: cupin domain-containing protein [Burkholderiaceae bacterium]|nr:cupin domain-containing protein [Burkholderiaceae bacterium]
MSAALTPLSHLGTMPVHEFLARYWQRQAVCIRQAIAGFTSPISRPRLFALASDPEVESRLVTVFSGRWKVRAGPIFPRAMPSLHRARWTLLVQGVDLHDAAVWALAARFRFVPVARFDDVMVSYASDAGGVGPHVDQYDVFLLQAQGRRRWRVATEFDPRPVQEVPLRLLANFRHQREWVLEPGDLLYLPPGVAHEGVALGACITISIGFRLPDRQEILEAWIDRQSRAPARVDRFADCTRTPTQSPARLPASLLQSVARELDRARATSVQVRRTLLEHLTEPKPAVTFTPRPGGAALPRFAGAARRRGVILDLRTRMLYQGADIAINGEVLASIPPVVRRLLRALANRQYLAPPALAGVGGRNARALFSLLYNWYRFGWLHVGAK